MPVKQVQLHGHRDSEKVSDLSSFTVGGDTSDQLAQIQLMNAYIPGLGKNDERFSQLPMEQRETLTALSTFGDPSSDQWHAPGPSYEHAKRFRMREMFGFEKYACVLDSTGSSNFMDARTLGNVRIPRSADEHMPENQAGALKSIIAPVLNKLIDTSGRTKVGVRQGPDLQPVVSRVPLILICNANELKPPLFHGLTERGQ